MANTFTSLHYHVIFSTKHREPWITPDLEDRVWKFLGGIARENGMKALLIGGMPDHVHLALALPPSQSVSKALQLLKGGSSKWIKDTLPQMRSFAWQDGYGAFTVSKSNLSEVIAYIQNQRKHHRIKTFKEEFLTFLVRHGAEYDEHYLWD
ncbi:MAG: IS200/IS605 family transposase [Verrucomicrobiia bacterium]